MLRFRVPLSEFTTYRIGGPAKLFFSPVTQEEAVAAVADIARLGERRIRLGYGSNMLFRDSGFDGAVLWTGGLRGRRRIGDDWECMAGENLTAVISEMAAAGCAGIEKLAGIPGSVGGAVIMNAGAYDTWFLDHVIEISRINGAGKLETLTREEFSYGYRRQKLVGEHDVLVKCRIRTRPGNARELKAAIRAIQENRRAKHPLELPNCGSVFRNPEGHFAWKLIEDCGLRGRRVGGAQVSEKHTNFIVNVGGASSEDVRKLIGIVKETVFQKKGLQLEEELVLV